MSIYVNGQTFHLRTKNTSYILGVYELLDYVTTKYPNVFIEGCAGGGGRYDCGMMYYTPQIWTSDATYNIPELDITAKGRTLMEFGLSINLEFHDDASILCHINKV